MFGKNISDVSEKDLDILFGILESSSVDYKQELPEFSDNGKREFLADVSSFANVGGGYIFYGVTEIKGTASAINGVEIKDPDSLSRSLTNILDDCIKPRVTFNLHPVKLNNGRYLVILQINYSWNSPHRVEFQKHREFYSRSGPKRIPLDVYQLRDAFIASNSVHDNAKQFHLNRVTKILNDDVPIPLDKGARVIIDIIPLESFKPGFIVDWDKGVSYHLSEFKTTSLSCKRNNFDGYLLHQGHGEELNQRYIQLFRNGIIEYVFAYEIEQNKLFPIVSFEKRLVGIVEDSLNVFLSLNINLPIAIYCSLINVKGLKAPSRHITNRAEGFPIDREILNLPVHLLESKVSSIDQFMKPLCDILSNSFGLKCSSGFDSNGNLLKPF